MADNVLQTLQRLVQDVIAPDVRELKVRMASLEKLIDERFKSADDKTSSLDRSMDEKFKSTDDRILSFEKSIDAKFKSVDERFTSFEKQSEAQFKAILAAINASHAETELANFRDLAALTGRVIALEAGLTKQQVFVSIRQV